MTWEVCVRARVGALNLAVNLQGHAGPTVLIGPNGAGKTTLLRLIAGAFEPDAGRIVIGGKTLFDSERGINVPAEHRGVGYVPQGYGLFPHLRVLDNVAFGMSTWARRQPRKARCAAARALLSELGVGHLAARLPRGLSGGEQQRVALARALLVAPRMLLLDEPLSALDASARRVLRRFLAARLAQSGHPALVVTHDRRDVTALAAHVGVIEEGRVVQEGSPKALAAHPATAFVAEFFDVDDAPTQEPFKLQS